MVQVQSSESEPSSKLSNSISSPQIEFYFLTLFPEVFTTVLNSSLLGKAQERGLVKYNLIQIRDFAKDKHRTVDDTPYGGGEGMVLKPDVLWDAWSSVSLKRPEPEPELGSEASSLIPQKSATILLSPQGVPFSQSLAQELASYSQLVLVCGHYEGVDERFIDLCVDREVSIGDYVLTGGELPALVLADVITRLVPGVVGNSRSLSEESLENGLLKYPHYTRPREFNGLSVPQVLLDGDHGAIRAWRESQKLERTQKKRPDLWESYLAATAQKPKKK